MNRVFDKGILLLLCSVFLFQTDNTAQPVIAFLLALAGASLGIYLESHKHKAVLILTLSVTGIFLPELLLFFPVLLYDCFQEKLTAGFGFLAPLLLYLLRKQETLPIMDIVPLSLWTALWLLSWLLAMRTQKLILLEKEMIRMRDASTELNLVLKEKNKDLMEKQDYEIYLATLGERNRIAREIHDHVGHMLSRSILQVGALATIHKEAPLHEQLTQINDTLNLAMTNIRESVHDLHDDSIDLKQAITEAVSPLREKYHVAVDFDMSAAVPKNVKYCLIATVKESVSNVLKHSNCTKVSFTFREHPGFYQCTVEDNGSKIVFSTTQLLDHTTELHGIGLSNMQDRVEALGGAFRVNTEHGFRIFLSIPKQPEV